MREDAETEGIKRAIRQVSGGLVDLPQGGDVRMDGIRVPVRAGCGARRRVRGSVRGALGDVRAGRCRRRTGGARGGEDAARGARIDRAERGQGGAAIRGRVAQETQIRSVAEEAAAHLTQDDGADRDHSEGDREPQVQGSWRAFGDAVGLHWDCTCDAYRGGRAYRDPQESSRRLYPEFEPRVGESADDLILRRETGPDPGVDRDRKSVV